MFNLARLRNGQIQIRVITGRNVPEAEARGSRCGQCAPGARHPADSTNRQWRVGGVRGILSVQQAEDLELAIGLRDEEVLVKDINFTGRSTELQCVHWRDRIAQQTKRHPKMRRAGPAEDVDLVAGSAEQKAVGLHELSAVRRGVLGLDSVEPLHGFTFYGPLEQAVARRIADQHRIEVLLQEDGIAHRADLARDRCRGIEGQRRRLGQCGDAVAVNHLDLKRERIQAHLGGEHDAASVGVAGRLERHRADHGSIDEEINLLDGLVVGHRGDHLLVRATEDEVRLGRSIDRDGRGVVLEH